MIMGFNDAHYRMRERKEDRKLNTVLLALQ